jgi:hypothetical protein
VDDYLSDGLVSEEIVNWKLSYKVKIKDAINQNRGYKYNL